MKNRDYQYNYTDENKIAREKMYQKCEREVKAKKILAVLKDYFNETDSLDLLDMSCSTGYMINYLSRYFKSSTGIDIDKKALNFAKQINSRKNINFFEMDALNTNFQDCSFDVIICNQMYEHVSNPKKLFQEIYRILKNGGVCYFSATSRLVLIETHYGKVPFLSLLPRSLAHIYLRVLGKSDHYYEILYTYWGLRNLVSNFDVIDYTKNIILNPNKFFADDVIKSNLFGKSFKNFILTFAYKFLPGYIWILRKGNQK